MTRGARVGRGLANARRVSKQRHSLLAARRGTGPLDDPARVVEREWAAGAWPVVERRRAVLAQRAAARRPFPLVSLVVGN